MPLVASAAPAGTSCLQKEAAGNLGSSPLHFPQLDHADSGLELRPSIAFSSLTVAQKL